MKATKTGTYAAFGQEPVRNLGAGPGTACPVPPGALGPAGLGELDLDPKLDLRQDRVEPGIAGGGFQVGGGIAQPAHRGGIEIAGEQADLEIVEHVEGASAACHRAPAPLRRVLLDALQREQRIDAGRSLGRDRRPCLRARGHVFRQREAGRACPPGVARGRSERRAVRSVDAHHRPSRGAGVMAVSFAFLWLTPRKRPGKICRALPVFALARMTRRQWDRKNYRTRSIHYVFDRTWHGARMVNRGSVAMGVAHRSRESFEGSRGCGASGSWEFW